MFHAALIPFVYFNKWEKDRTRADNFVLVKFGFSALSVPRFFGV